MSRLDDLRKQAEQNVARKNGRVPVEAKEIVGTPDDEYYTDAYQAYSATPHVIQTQFRLFGNSRVVCLRYDMLYEISTWHDFGDIMLIFPHHTIRIFGRNLKDVFTALEDRSLRFLGQYDARIWEHPPEENEPIIERVEFERYPSPSPKNPSQAS